MARILIVDDEKMIRDVIREYAEFEGYETREAQNGIEAVEWCRKEDFDVAVIDVMMQGIDGFAVYEKIKKLKDIPALILSARGEEYDKLYGYSLGIDDYVVKPFSPKELMARIAVIISRTVKKRVPDLFELERISYEGLVIDMRGHNVFIDGVKSKMTAREYELLLFLAKYPNTVFSRQQLLDKIWGYDYIGEGRTVDSHIKMLRHSLGIYRKFIVTVRGVGYKLEVDR
jgi:DNA-binding response OmpR family regulator